MQSSPGLAYRPLLRVNIHFALERVVRMVRLVHGKVQTKAGTHMVGQTTWQLLRGEGVPQINPCNAYLLQKAHRGQKCRIRAFCPGLTSW